MQLGAYEQAKSLGENFADKSKGHEIIELAFDWVQDYREKGIFADVFGFGVKDLSFVP
jgi:hypothetical protein